MKVEIKKISIEEIKPNKKNPRNINDDKYETLLNSLKSFPEMLELREIIVDENMTILGGNMRHKALMELGEKEIFVKIVSGLTKKQKDEFLIKDNVALGEWNFDMLKMNFVIDDLKYYGLDIPEFDMSILDEMEIKEKKLDEIHQIVIDCKNENEQKEQYESLTNLGYICRLLIL